MMCGSKPCELLKGWSAGKLHIKFKRPEMEKIWLCWSSNNKAHLLWAGWVIGLTQPLNTRVYARHSDFKEDRTDLYDQSTYGMWVKEKHIQYVITYIMCSNRDILGDKRGQT